MKLNSFGTKAYCRHGCCIKHLRIKKSKKMLSLIYICDLTCHSLAQNMFILLHMFILLVLYYFVKLLTIALRPMSHAITESLNHTLTLQYSTELGAS